MNIDIKSVVKKIEMVSGAEWKGYLRADEAKLLRDAGAIFSPTDSADIDKYTASGHSKPRWWFFRLTENMRRALSAM